MRRARLRVVASAVVGWLAACSPTHDAACPGGDCPGDAGGGDGGVTSCTTTPDCATGVCEPASMTCVQCTADEPGACTGTTPICDADFACRGCSTDTECAGATCLPDGSCVDEAQVAYVAATGAGSACTRADPCPSLALGLATNRPFVKVAGILTDTATTVIGRRVTITAEPGTSLGQTGAGPVVVAGAGADATISDLEIRGGSGNGVALAAGGPVVALVRVKITNNRSGSGIDVASGTLTADRCTISDNKRGIATAAGTIVEVRRSTLTGNADAGVSAKGSLVLAQSTIMHGAGAGAGVRRVGVSVASAFEISSSVIVGFESGLEITNPVTTSSFTFNTVTGNHGQCRGVDCGISTGGGVVMPGTVATPCPVFANNIVHGNTRAQPIILPCPDPPCDPPEIEIVPFDASTRSCPWTYSDLGDNPFVAGATNIYVAPLLDTTFHLSAGSPARDLADPGATEKLDVDGDPRPQGARRDIGADEYKP